jgi:hypothetical protein
MRIRLCGIEIFKPIVWQIPLYQNPRQFKQPTSEAIVALFLFKGRELLFIDR